MTQKIQKWQCPSEYAFNRFLRVDHNIFVDLYLRKTKTTFSQVAGIVGAELNLGWNDAIAAIKSVHRWRAWSGDFVFVPNGEKVIYDQGAYHLNSWRACDVVPSNSEDGAFFKDFLLTCLGDEESVNFVISFLAHRYQNPLDKVHQALFLYGDHGQGKGTLAEILQKVFGDSAIKRVVKANDLTQKGTVANWSGVFVIGEEIKIEKGSEFYNEMKAYTGALKINADKKHVDYDLHQIPAQLILFSNHAPTFLEDGDRRFFVKKFNTNLCDKDKDDYFTELRARLENGGYEGIAALLQNWDLSGYNKHGKPPMTKEKQSMMLLSRDATVEKIMSFLEDNPELCVFEMDSFNEFFDKYSNDNQRKHKLREAGLVKTEPRVKIAGKQRKGLWVREGGYISTKQGSNGTCYVDADGIKWRLEDVYQAPDQTEF